MSGAAPTHWIQLHLTVERRQAPLAELLFEELGALSVTLSDAADEALLEPPPGATPLWRQTRVTALFSGDSDVDRLRGEINRALNEELSRQLRVERLAEQQWERSWLRDFRPMRFGSRLWICPDGQRPDDAADGVFVDLDPGLAFGTGTHPTTALCLNWLDRHDLDGLRLLDFGCGSGVLAIAALKLGAERVIAVDHDPQALQATRDNGARNGVLERLDGFLGGEEPADPVDLVVANILAGALIDLQPLFAGRLAGGGRIILSGILPGQAERVTAAYAGEFAMCPPVERDGWVLLEGRRR